MRTLQVSSNRDILQRNAAWARANLGMPAAEFYALTPVEFARVHREWLRVQKREDTWWAKLCWVVAVSAGMKLQEPSKRKAKPDPLALPMDFFAPWFKMPTKPKRAKPYDAIADLIGMVKPGNLIDNRKKRHGK